MYYENVEDSFAYAIITQKHRYKQREDEKREKENPHERATCHIPCNHSLPLMSSRYSGISR